MLYKKCIIVNNIQESTDASTSHNEVQQIRSKTQTLVHDFNDQDYRLNVVLIKISTISSVNDWHRQKKTKNNNFGEIEKYMNQ